MFSTLMKWLLRLSKHVVVLLSIPFSWFFILHILFTSLNHNLKLTIVFSNFMHAECITQHCVHVITLFCASTSCICGRAIRVRTCNRTPDMLLTVPKPCSVCSHYSFTPCQVGKYDTGRVVLVISIRLTRAVYISIGDSTVTNCKVNKQLTPISVFPRTPRLCHRSLVHLFLYVQYKIVTK
jgi:hypothetical protein